MRKKVFIFTFGYYDSTSPFAKEHETVVSAPGRNQKQAEKKARARLGIDNAFVVSVKQARY